MSVASNSTHSKGTSEANVIGAIPGQCPTKNEISVL